jgi:hypothetical protein
MAGKFQTQIIRWHHDLSEGGQNRKGGGRQESYKLMVLKAMHDTSVSVLLSKCSTNSQSGQMRCFGTVKAWAGLHTA